MSEGYGASAGAAAKSEARSVVDEGGLCSSDSISFHSRCTDDWRGLVVNDLVQLACGELGCDVLGPGEVGQVIKDRRQGATPFLVQGPRGERAWFRADSLIRALKVRRRTSLQSHHIKPLVQQVVEALDPQTRLDFPRVTDICEAASRNPAGAEVALAVLVATLGKQELKAGDTRSITQDYIKVLTIVNELLYDSQLVEILRRTPGLKPAVERLRDFREGQHGDTNDENIRMLATEIEKGVFHATGKAGQPTPHMDIIAFCPEGHVIAWKEGQSVFHVHARMCASCKCSLPRTAERYNCRTCYYYDVCVSCMRWGAPQHIRSIEPMPQLADFLTGPPARRRSLSQ